ncbi:META domain-containing protein [Pannus brasiliensis CCIBt3594]|uniref:META domain-containing protein n=1 Tax=Pannus brasiliensis CCIBt3594 TaxID=1427578 RepID=A0AAW9QUS4_9CHRO
MRQKITGILAIVAVGGAMMAGGSIAQNTSPMNETPRTLDGTNWKLSGWTGRNLVEGTEITASFKGTNLGGSAGCNRYIARYQTKEDSFSVKPEIATTMMACPEPRMKQEQAFLTALKGVREYAINGAGELQLVYRVPDGLGMLTFVRTAAPERGKK